MRRLIVSFQHNTAAVLSLVAALCGVSATAAAAFGQSVDPVQSLVALPADTTVVLEPGDLVRIAVWRNAELSGEFVIGPDGSITHPLYREVKAAGVPVAEVERRVGAFLARYGESNPAFTVTALIRVFVFGEVRTPNAYTVPPGSTIAQAIAAAGGPTERGRLDKVQILRNSHRLALDLTSSDARAIRALVHSGDQIYVPRARSVFSEIVVPASSLLAAAAAVAGLLLHK